LVTANVAAKANQNAILTALDGNAEVANKINDPLYKLHKNLFCEPNPIPVKWAAERIVLITSGSPWLPLVPLDEKFYPVIEEALGEAGSELATSSPAPVDV
jgi:4-hydroxy-tetrahydrodipicolinate synthase